MNYKAILIMAIIIIVTLVALTQALHTYEESNITLEEHHNHGETGEHEHAESENHEDVHVESENHEHQESK